MARKANDLKLEHLLDFSEKSKIPLEDFQMTITSAEAWGVLRKDLITALGVQRAKRFLLRYGWNCGVQEARMLRKAIQWSDDLEWLIAGTKMHQLSGRVFSYPENFDVDMKTGKFNVSGFWLDSYEVKQHLKYFSLYHEPICYFLSGYASGYTSECMGKKIIFKESRCKGKGDEYCSYIGKTVEEWGAEIAEELMFYEDDDMSGELDQMYRRVEQEKEKFKIGYTLSRSLNQAMLQGKGLENFAELLGKNLHCPVIIENNSFERQAAYGELPGIEQYLTARNIGYQQLTEMMEKNQIIVTELKDRTFKILISPIIVKNQIFGFIIIAPEQENEDFYKDLLERVTTASALYIQNERTAIETENRLNGEMLEHLLNNKEVDVREIYNRFLYLGYDLSEPYYVINVELDNGENENNSLKSSYDYLKIRDKLVGLFYRFLESHNTNILISAKLNMIQMVISKKMIESERTTIKKFAERMLEQIENKLFPIYFGISGPTQNISQFYQMSVEAKKAVEVAKMKSKTSSVMLSSELGHLTLFLNARSPKELEDFAISKLSPIILYDDRKNAELVQTLYFYSQYEFNLRKTAREMNVSLTGMRYRIEKIEELLELDLSLSNNRFEIQAALQILFVMGKLKI
ncbi:XylR N-terminal domain-containing protein [Neobacillus vireti]|uniref:XylR N-terminal domain-containing protein n=1 Tax=Neobacillus vireti TaxID=220686 RepID=UPI002FFDFEA1